MSKKKSTGSGLGELEKLTKAEKLVVHRRREGFTQVEMADKRGIKRVEYGAMERGDVEFRPAVNIGGLTAHERCFLYRRRAGSTQAEVAIVLGCCRWLVNQMERGDIDCTTLCNYWES